MISSLLKNTINKLTEGKVESLEPVNGEHACTLYSTYKMHGSGSADLLLRRVSGMESVRSWSHSGGCGRMLACEAAYATGSLLTQAVR